MRLSGHGRSFSKVLYYHRVIQVRMGPGRPPVPPPAQNGIAYGIRLGSLGLCPAGSWKTSKDSDWPTLLGSLLHCLSVPVGLFSCFALCSLSHPPSPMCCWEELGSIFWTNPSQVGKGHYLLPSQSHLVSGLNMPQSSQQCCSPSRQPLASGEARCCFSSGAAHCICPFWIS